MLSHIIFVIIQALKKSKVNVCLHNQQFSPSYANLSLIAFLVKSLDIKKASELDEIPPKVVKAASVILSVPRHPFHAICHKLLTDLLTIVL